MNVLFLCAGNSARSIMAEATLNGLGLDKLSKRFLQKHLDEIGQTKDAATTRQSA